MITLIATDVIYFSKGDEESFFAWLNRIGAVSDVRGVGHELIITLRDGALSDADLREFIGVFHRYHVDKKQLSQFATGQNVSWFRDNPDAFWHRDIFG